MPDIMQSSSDSSSRPETAHQLIRRTKRIGRRRISAEDKTRIVMEGLRGEESVSDLCRREGLYKNAYYKWLKEFLEAGKKRLSGDYVREATSSEVKDLRRANEELKLLLSELLLENRRLKKSHVTE